MPTPTYIPLANITLGSSASSVTFSSISQAYRDLILVVTAKHSYAGSVAVRDSGARFNSDSSSTYSEVYMQGNGSAASSSTNSSTSSQFVYGMASGDFVPGIMQIMDYSATDKHKTYLYRAGSGSDTNYGSYAMAGRWPSTSAITTITIAPSGSYTFLSGSSFALYGIAS